MSHKRHCEIKHEWADAVDCHAEDCDDWPVERILELEAKIERLKRMLHDRMDTLERLNDAGDTLLPDASNVQFGDGLDALLDAPAKIKRLREYIQKHVGATHCKSSPEQQEIERLRDGKIICCPKCGREVKAVPGQHEMPGGAPLCKGGESRDSTVAAIESELAESMGECDRQADEIERLQGDARELRDVVVHLERRIDLRGAKLQAIYERVDPKDEITLHLIADGLNG